ncbi:hypothetical protein [Streptomyces sp. NPDC050988]|uniref:hypothetical protein n=1 Tax=Streptomyces sp. NPDC050988 TaxID=3365637 RepID=UPI003790ED10
MNAMLLRNGFPGLPDQDPGSWTLLWMTPWAALSLLAAACSLDDSIDRMGRGDPVELTNDKADVDVDHGGFAGGD